MGFKSIFGVVGVSFSLLLVAATSKPKPSPTATPLPSAEPVAAQTETVEGPAAPGRRFDMRDALLRNSILIVSEAPLERTIAMTNFVSGWVEVNPGDLKGGIKGEMELDLRTIDLGLEVKSIQMREEILKVSENPSVTAQFEMAGLKGKLEDTEPLKIKPEVKITLKGITKTVKVPLELTYFKEDAITKLKLVGNLLRARSTFTLDLGVFDISFPESQKHFFNKKVQISLELFGTDRPPTGFTPLPEAPKAKVK